MTPWAKVFNKTQAESQLKYSLTVFADKSNLCRGLLFYNKVKIKKCWTKQHTVAPESTFKRNISATKYHIKYHLLFNSEGVGDNFTFVWIIKSFGCF